ncbi:MAG: putative porin [Bacteroidales bacterium]|nr:putative porin [Bacteroidales bacterium]
MKKVVTKIWVPLLLVLIAALQSFGIDASRAVRLRSLADSLALTIIQDSLHTDSTEIDSLGIDSLAIDSLALDTLALDTLALDTLAIDTLVIAARDTIKIPDSLQYTDPFFYKYYIAVKDSVTRAQVRDSLIMAGDTLELMKLDSLYIKDSTEVAIAKHNAWYASLSRKERKKYDAEQRLPELIRAANRKLEIKDSIKAYKDSVLQATPRILETFAFPDSLHYKRIVTWKHDRYFHNLEGLRDQSVDSSFNYNFHDYPFFQKDVNASWLGVAGSPAQLYDYFKRSESDNAIFFTPYSIYTYTPENLPQFNTKTPYTELAYYGTLFANKEKEESNIRIRTTQNITPELNILLEYHRFGGNGMLKREDTDNRTVVMAANYTGKKYLMHTGYIYDRIERSENGGVIDSKWIRDTIVDSREIEVYLRDASNKYKRNTLFLDQTYRIPFTFLDKEYREQRKAEKIRAAVRDSIMATGDSLAIAAYNENEATRLEAQADASEAADTIQTDITTAFIGHSSEYSVFRKTYEDNITDDFGRAFYNDRFYINPTHSKDSLRSMKFENRLFIRLQPWKSDGIVSKLDIGIGDKLANYFTFKPSDYIQGSQNVLLNSAYLYAGAQGQYDKYLEWDAFGKYNFLGYEVNDFNISANATFKAYPFRKDRQSPLELKAHFETNLKQPDYYQQHLFTNHYKWDNDFSKISTTKVEASLSIPRWKLDASFGYALLDNNIYYDTLGIVRQNTKPMSVMTASLRKDFQLWKFHFDHRLLFQLTSDKDVMPLPMLGLNLRYYAEFDVVKNAMRMQIGANGTFTTKWYAPAYNPVLGVFHNQNKEQFGGCPYIDVFVNVQWKRVSVFLKAVNLNMGWPLESADYFSAAGYIAPQRAFKIGITWPFYVQPGRNSTSANGGKSTAGGGMNGGAARGGRANSGRQSTNMMMSR